MPGRTVPARGRTSPAPGRTAPREDCARSGQDRAHSKEDCTRSGSTAADPCRSPHRVLLGVTPQPSLSLVINSHPARGHRPLLTFPGGLLHASFFPPRSASQTTGRTPPQGRLPSGPVLSQTLAFPSRPSPLAFCLAPGR